MKPFPLQRRTLALLAVIVPLLALFIFVALRSGPLAPVAVTVITVTSRPLMPALFGVGTVEARYSYRIGPTFPGRVKRLDVNVGDRVQAGQVLGEMEPIDLDERVRSLASGYRRAEAAVREAAARQAQAQSQWKRYEKLVAARMVSDEAGTTKQQELLVADAGLAAARAELARAKSDHEALVSQRGSLRLISPVDGVVALREVDPGTTVVAGQAVVEVIDPASLWVNVRFDQAGTFGLAAGLPARVVLRSRGDHALAGRVLRVEPKADAVTEETLAKVVFDTQPEILPPVGELAEVTVNLPAFAAGPVIPNAALRREGERTGVWAITDGKLLFMPVKLGAVDLDGNVQVREGLKEGTSLVLYSERLLTARSRIKVLEQIPGAPQ